MEPNCDSKSRKKCVSIKKYKVVRAVAALLCIMMLAITIVPTITTYAAEDQDDSYTMDTVANALGTIMSLGTMPIRQSDDDSDTTFEITGISVLYNTHGHPGNAGLVMSFTSHSTSLGQWLASKASASSTKYDYMSLMKLPTVKVTDDEGTEETGSTGGVYEYAVYGYALSQLGFDKTAAAATSGGFIRFFTGLIMLIVYCFSSFVDGIFQLAIWLLMLLNPFSWLESVAKTKTAALGSQYSTTFNGTGPIQMVMQYIASIYVTICNLSWAFIIPMSIGLYLANMLLFRKTAGGKRLMKRILFTAIGVPLVGGTYTSFLHEMYDMAVDSVDYADDIIASTFIDFEGWASTSRLAVPEDGEISVYVPVYSSGDGYAKSGYKSFSNGGEVSDATMYDIQNLCAEINSMASGHDFNSIDRMSEGYTFDTTNQTTINVDADGRTDAEQEALEQEHWDDLNENVFSEEELNVNTYKDFNTPSAWIRDLLTRYMFGDTYTSEQYASSIQSRMTSFSDSDVVTEVGKMLQATSRHTNFRSYPSDETMWGKLASIFSSDSNSLLFKDESWFDDIASTGNTNFGDYSIFNDGGLKCEYLGWDGDVQTSTFTFSSDDINSAYFRNKAGAFQSVGEHRTGLSTMSMYNYLNNKFTSTGVITYGGGNAITNTMALERHYSVNIIGTNVTCFIYYISSLLLLLCPAIIGVMYGIGMFTGTFKYTFKVIGAMPMAVMGSMRYIAKFVGMVCAMMVNILITALMYTIVVEVIFGISNILFHNPLFFWIATAGGIAIGVLAITLVGNIFFWIILIKLTVMILRIRSSAVNSVTEWITQVVGKFFEADGHADPSKSKGNIGQKVASGLATGAALAGGHGMLKAASALGGALSGKDDGGSGDGSGGGDDGGGRNDSVGGGIEKEVSQDHNKSHDGTSKETNGGESRSESETKDAKVDRENANVEKDNSSAVNSDKENSSAVNRDAQSNSSTIVGTSSATHDSKDSESATHDSKDSESATHASEDSKSSTNNSDESTSATHDSNEKADKKEARAESASEHDRADKTHDSVSQVSESAAVKEAVSKDSSGTADVIKQNVDAVNDGGKNLKDAGKALAQGDVKGATENVKSAGKNVAGAVVADAVVATTGSTQAASAAGHLTDDAAKGNLNAGSALRATSAITGGATNGVAGQMPSSAAGAGGTKQLGGAGNASEAPKKSLSTDGASEAPKKSLGSGDSGTGSKPVTSNSGNASPSNSGTPSAQSSGNTKPATSNEGNVRSTQHTAHASAGGMTLNSNITNNITNGGTINNTQQAAGGGNGPSLNMTNNAAVGGNVQNVQNVTNNHSGGGGVVNNSAARNVQNVTNVNNVSQVSNGGGGGVTNVSGAKTVNNVTNVNNAQHVNSVNAGASVENNSRKK